MENDTPLPAITMEITLCDINVIHSNKSADDPGKPFIKGFSSVASSEVKQMIFLQKKEESFVQTHL